jgi:hypothetical protein
MDTDCETELKIQINNFLWMHAPGHLYLCHAETMACTILELLKDAVSRHSQEEWKPLEYKPHTRFRVRNARSTERATLCGLCYSFPMHFDIHWDDGSRVLDVIELGERGIFKDNDDE